MAQVEKLENPLYPHIGAATGSRNTAVYDCYECSWTTESNMLICKRNQAIMHHDLHRSGITICMNK